LVKINFDQKETLTEIKKPTKDKPNLVTMNSRGCSPDWQAHDSHVMGLGLA
jgi:hypothetical protein